MPTVDGWRPPEGDVHLRIWLSDVVLDYVATSDAVVNLLDDWRRRGWFTIEVIRDPLENCRLPRLPCECLFLGP